MPKDSAYLEAEKIIEKAWISGAVDLDFHNMKLSELPEVIGKLTSLQSLSLRDNQLKALPDAIGQLTQLQSLNLSGNKLTTLPQSLIQLKSLRSLNISYNQLPTAPRWLGQLAQLESLELSNIDLTFIPESIGQLTKLQKLDISNNKLTALPDSLGQLTQLTSLNLSDNQLTALPESIGQLTYLQVLILRSNNLKVFPASLGNLVQLQDINLGQNKLTTVPDIFQRLINLKILFLRANYLESIPTWLGELRSLEKLAIDKNKIKDLPDSFGNLKNLTTLYLGQPDGGNPLGKIPNCIRLLVKLNVFRLNKCELVSIPDWIGELHSLDSLDLHDNHITDLPTSISELVHLKNLTLDKNPLNPALQSAYNACEGSNYEPLFAYLRSLEGNAEPLYEAKLVLVGEGNVGKTTLLKALKGKAGEPPQKNEATTHGVEIDIHGLRLPHPAKDGVEIQLNAWDFGGQDVYRVTHQFFFSRRSLYLLVWEPRRGVQQGQVEDWLNMIRLRVGDDARVIIVSTHCKTGERIARIDKPVFKGQYGDMIVGFYEVDSLVPDPATGEMTGIAELKRAIAEHAAGLEQMGMLFNNDWKAARDELLARDEPRISFSTFSGICAAHGLSGIDTETLAHLMHDLGYIVHYSDDEKLRDDVILKPEWLTKAIGFVLEDRATQDAEGILPDARLTQVWRDHPFKDEPRYDPEIYPFFLHLMEKYDVCYRLPEGDSSLVAQHVPQVRPSLPWHPDEEPKPNQRRLGMVCVMDQTPEGLVPWMIVRTHDYAYPVGQHSLHWQKGMFLRHDRHGEAMLELRGREFHMYAEAIWPEYFMNVLRQTLRKLITDNWPGLEGRYSFTVPCKNNSCEGRFEIAALRDFLNDGDETIRCQKCRERQNIIELLYGFEDNPIEVQLREINQRLAGMDSRIANYFMATLRAIADEGKNGPRLFTFQQRGVDFSLKQLFTEPLELQLWCEAEGCQHPVYDEGIYAIDKTRDWVTALAPYANFVLGVLKTVSPIAAPAINVAFGAKTTETWGIKDKLDLTKAILDKLPTVKIEHRSAKPNDVLTEPERSGILALHRLLNELDPTQAKLGLQRVATYTGDYRWLCKHHYKAWQSNIPDVISSHD